MEGLRCWWDSLRHWLLNLDQGGLIVEEVTREMVDFACQTDFQEPVPTPPVPIVIAKSEMAIQVEPEPLLAVVRRDMSSQTDDEPIVV